MPDVHALSDRQARRVALVAQGLLGPRPAGGPGGVLRRLGAVQLDTISVLARSHQLVTHARLGAISPAAIDHAYWGEGSATFEYWSHAACILPLEDWPLYAAGRRARLARGRRWHRLEDAGGSLARVVERLEADGPLTARQLGGAKRGGPWWDWTETKIAAEWLLDVGTLVCRARRGFQRVYDLAERAVPPRVLATDLDDEDCHARLVTGALGALGVATAADLGAYHGLTQRAAGRAAGAAGLATARVEGWAQPAFVDEGALDALDRRRRRRQVLISPFDSLIWHRPRAERVFGIRHRLEAYVPAHRRVHGYFAMPVLAGDRFVGLVDPGRRGRTLVAKQASVSAPGALPDMAAALLDAAGWVGCDNVVVERLDPPGGLPELRRLLAAAG